LDQADIRHHVGNSVIYQRGYGYYRAGRVVHLEVRDEHLLARVTGSYGNTYKVEIWCEQGEVLSTCTCPYTWDVCKHVAATLCTWLNRRADPQTYTTTTTSQWRAQLEAIPPQVLIDQIMDEIRIDLMLERYVKRWVEQLSPEKLPKLITKLFRTTHAGSPADTERALERLGHVLNWAESVAPEHAIKVASETLKQTQARPDLMPLASSNDAVTRSLNILRTCVPQANLEAPARRALLRLLVKLIEYQAPAWHDGLTEVLLELTDSPGERAVLIDEVRKKAVGDEPGLMGMLARLYKLEGRMEEYAAARSKSLVDENDYLELFQYYIQENRPEEAMVLGEQGMKQLGISAPQLAERLTMLYLEWSERDLARTHLLHCFNYWPSEELLRQIESLSKEKKDWKTERARLQKKLTAVGSRK
jgi:uncharacterized Zn finger protein